MATIIAYIALATMRCSSGFLSRSSVACCLFSEGRLVEIFKNICVLYSLSWKRDQQAGPGCFEEFLLAHADTPRLRVIPTACLGYSHLAPLFRKALPSFLLTTTFSLHSFLHQNRHEVPLHPRSSRRSFCLRRSRIFSTRPCSSFQPQRYFPPCE